MKFSTGDKVEVETKKGKYTGIVMPSPDSNILTLKLDNGYNIGFEIKNIKAKKIGKETFEKLPEYKLERSNLPKISLITTGGTITSRVDYKTGAVHPLSKPEELLLSIPELKDICNIEKISQPFSILSEDMTPKHWKEIAEEVAEELNSDSEGAIVTHGTDTLHFTAAALSFMLKNLNKPVAIVGGQRSSDRGSFDGALNLICAAQFCKSDIAEVAVVMHGTMEDTYCLANRGTKVRKMHSSRRDTFRPINELPIAKVFSDGKIEILNKNFRKRNNNKVIADTKFEENIALIKFAPNLSPNLKNYKGIIIEGTGFGHVSESWLNTIKKLSDKILVCMTSQTIYGSTDPEVYSRGRELKKAGVIYLGDMLPEVAYIKLGWVLAHSKDLNEAKELMLKNIAGEFNPKISAKSFLY